MPAANLTVTVGICIFLILAAVGVIFAVLSGGREKPAVDKALDPRNLHRFGNSEKVILSWCGANDVTETVKCRLIDISEHGLAVRSKLALDLGTYLYITIPGLRLATTANVRRCAASGWKFDLGLEFRGPLYRA
jgi:hypothetical protein